MKHVKLGSLLPPGEGALSVDPRVLADGCLVVGTEGGGKTSLGRHLFGALLRYGASVIAIDTTGDLTQGFIDSKGLELQRGVGRVPSVASEKRETAPPGSVSDLVTLAALDLSLASNLFSRPSSFEVSSERLFDEVHDLVAALLALLGYRARKVSPEFALLENVVFHELSAGRDLPLRMLPQLVREPPIQRLGLYGVDTAISPNRRADLASAISAMLETPSFAYASGSPGLSVTTLLRGDGPATGWVLSFADRSPKIRRFLLAAILAKLKTYMASQWTAGDLKLVLWVDEAADFLPRGQRTMTSAPLLEALRGWERHGAAVALVADQPSDLEDDVQDLCETWFAGKTPVSTARRHVVEALDLVNPPIDEVALDAQLKSLRPGQFILRSRWLDTLKAFQLER